MSPEYAAEWARKAEADRAAAKRALQDCRRRRDQAEIACFHAQQCAEKYLKAVLAKNGQPIRRVHDLLALGRHVESHGLDLNRFRKGLISLQQYAVEIRYPGSTATVPEARKAVAIMERIVQAAADLISE